MKRIEEAALYQPTEQFLSRSGKRIRESLVQISYKMAGGDEPMPSAIGQSIELLHAGSLVIDDIQDDSCTRRGQPTLHRQIGMPLALNAGNWMYFRALEILLNGELSGRVQNRLLREMIRCGNRCHAGQSIDLSARIDNVSPENWKQTAGRISHLKTGALVSLAAKFGAIAAGATRERVRHMGQFGKNIGIALQMRNDLDELASVAGYNNLTAAKKGVDGELDESRWDDMRHARVTWPWAWVFHRVPETTVCRWRDQVVRTPNDKSLISDIASQILSIVQVDAVAMIAARVDHSLAILGEHVVDASQLAAMRDTLSAITNYPEYVKHVCVQ